MNNIVTQQEMRSPIPEHTDQLTLPEQYLDTTGLIIFGDAYIIFGDAYIIFP